MFNGRRQPSCGGTSRMIREYQVRICERLGVKFPGSTRPMPQLFTWGALDLALVRDRNDDMASHYGALPAGVEPRLLPPRLALSGYLFYKREQMGESVWISDYSNSR